MMGKPRAVAMLANNTRESVRVALEDLQGHHLLDLRVMARLASHSTAMSPTAKGLSVNVGMIPDLRLALADAEAQAVALGWLPGTTI